MVPLSQFHIRILPNGPQDARPGKFRFAYAESPATQRHDRDMRGIAHNPNELGRICVLLAGVSARALPYERLKTWHATPMQCGGVARLCFSQVPSSKLGAGGERGWNEWKRRAIREALVFFYKTPVLQLYKLLATPFAAPWRTLPGRKGPPPHMHKETKTHRTRVASLPSDKPSPPIGFLPFVHSTSSHDRTQDLRGTSIRRHPRQNSRRFQARTRAVALRSPRESL